MEQNKRVPNIPENYVHYPLKYYRNITKWVQNPQVPTGAENSLPRHQNVLRGVLSNVSENDKLTNKFLNSVQQFENMKNNFQANHHQRQEMTHRQVNLQNCQTGQGFRPSSSQRFQNPQTGHFESTKQKFTPSQQRFNLRYCPPYLIPPLLPPPIPPLLPPPLPPLPQFQGQMFLNDSIYNIKKTTPKQNRQIRHENFCQMTSQFLDNDANYQYPYSKPKQVYSEQSTENLLSSKPSMIKNQYQLKSTGKVLSDSLIKGIRSVNCSQSSIGYAKSYDPTFIQSPGPFEYSPQRFANPRNLTDCVETSKNIKQADNVNRLLSQNCASKTKSPCEKYEHQMKISMLGNSMNLQEQNDQHEFQRKLRKSNLNHSDSKIEKWSFDFPMKQGVKNVQSLTSRKNVSMDTGKENMPQDVFKRLCKSTVKKNSKYLLLTSPKRTSTPSDMKLLNHDNNKNKIRKFELAKLESKRLNSMWLSPILSENKKSEVKYNENCQLDSRLKTLGRSRPMVNSRKCNRNLFDTIPNQRVTSSNTLDNFLGKSSKSVLKASKYSSHCDISDAELDCLRLDSTFKDFQQTTNSKSGNSNMYDPCVISMSTNSRSFRPLKSHSVKSSDFCFEACNNNLNHPSSFADFEDNIGTSDHDGAVTEDSTDAQADTNSDNESHCSSNLSQYSTVYDDFRRIQDKAIKEAKESKVIQKCEQISSFMPSNRTKWHLRSNTYPLFSPAKRTLGEKAEFKNRARKRSFQEKMSLAPCRIVIEDLKQMKDRFCMVQQKSKSSGCSYKNSKEDAVGINLRLRANPTCYRSSLSGSTSSVASKTNKMLRSKRSASFAPSSRNRHSSDSSTSKNSKSSKSLGAYFDTATSKLVKVQLPSRIRQPKFLRRSPCLQSLPVKQKLLLVNDWAALSPNTRPRSVKSPLTNKDLGRNACEKNEPSDYKLRPGGLGIEWAEIQSGSPFGGVKKAQKSGCLKEFNVITDEELSCFSATATEDDATIKLKKLGKEERSTALNNKEQLDGLKPSISTSEVQEASSRSSNILEEYQDELTNVPDHFHPDVYDIDTDSSNSDMYRGISKNTSRKFKDTEPELTSCKKQDVEDIEENRTDKNYQHKISSPKNKLSVIPTSNLLAKRPASPIKTRLSNGIRRNKTFVGYRNNTNSPISKKSKLSDHNHQRVESSKRQSVFTDLTVKIGNHSKRERPCKTKNLIRSDALPIGHVSKIEGTLNSSKNHTENPESTEKRYSFEILNKKRCTEVDVRLAIPQNNSNDAANKGISKNKTVFVKSEKVGRKQQNIYDTPNNMNRCMPLREHPQVSINKALEKRNTKGSYYSELFNLEHRKKVAQFKRSRSSRNIASEKSNYTESSEASQTGDKLKRFSYVHRKSTTRRISESSTTEVNEASSVVSKSSPKAKKKRSEEEVKQRGQTEGNSLKKEISAASKSSVNKLDIKHADYLTKKAANKRTHFGGTVHKKESSTVNKNYVDVPDTGYEIMPNQNRQKGSPKFKNRCKEERSLKTKSVSNISRTKTFPHTSQERRSNEDKQHQKSHIMEVSSKTNSDPHKSLRKHRRVDKCSTTDNNAVRESIKGTRHNKKKTSFQGYSVPKQQIENAGKKQEIHIQSSHHKDKVDVTKDLEQSSNQKTQPRKPKLVITQGIQNYLWCKFCHGFRGKFADLKVHVNEKHPFRCHTCKAVFNSGAEIESHRKVHINKLYHCKLCQRDLQFRKGIIERHERSTYHKQLVRVQKQILEVILNKHGDQSLDGHSTDLPDLSQFADLIRFPTVVTSTEDTEAKLTEGQNSAIKRFYIENQEIKNLLLTVEQSLKETSTKKTTEVVLPHTYSSGLVQDQPIKIASVQPMVTSTNSQPITTEGSASQPVEFQPELHSLNFPEAILKPGQFTSECTATIASRSVNTSEYQLPETNSTSTYDSAQSNRLLNHNYSTPYPSDCFDFDLNVNDFGASKSEKSSENVLSDFLTSSKKIMSTDVPDDMLEFWSTNYYQNVDWFYDNIPTFGLSSNPTPVPVSDSLIVGATNQNPMSNFHHPMKVIPEKTVSECVSIVDISHSGVRMEKHMPFAEKKFQNCDANFTQHYQSPIMSSTSRNKTSIYPSATITEDFRENTENGGYNNIDSSKNVITYFQKDGLAIGTPNLQIECSEKTFDSQSNLFASHRIKDNDLPAQKNNIVQTEPVPINNLTSQLTEKYSTKLHSLKYPEKTVEKCSKTLPQEDCTGKLVAFEFQTCSTSNESSKLTTNSNSSLDLSNPRLKQITDKDFERTEILDRLLQPLISEAWCNLRSPLKHQVAITSNSLGKQNSPVKNQHGSPRLSNVPMSNTETKTSENIQHLSAKTYDIELKEIVSQAAERRSSVLKKTDESDSNILQAFNKFQLDKNIQSFDLNLNSKETTQTATDTAMEGLAESVEIATKLTLDEASLDAEESVVSLDDHNNTLINNISTLDDPDISLTSLINTVLPEDLLSKLPMKSLVDISETDIKMTEAKFDFNYSGPVADDNRSTNLGTVNISKISTEVKDTPSPCLITASDFIANLQEQSVKSTNFGLQVVENVCSTETSNTKLSDEIQDTITKNMTIVDLNTDKNTADVESCERQAFFLSLKLCESSQPNT